MEATQELIISLDRSDATLAVALLTPENGTIRDQVVSTTPEALSAWWDDLVQAHPARRLVVAFEQPAPNLLVFFAARRTAVIYALNPSATWAFRKSLTVSGARTDASDARSQAWFVCHHRDKLKAWEPVPAAVEQLDRLCQAKRKLVDQRTALTNRLQAVLKRFFPQALTLMHEDVWRPMNLAFLRRWPSPTKLTASRLSTVQAFFRQHGSRSEERWAARAALIKALVPLTEGNITSDLLETTVIVDQIEALNHGIQRYETAIAAAYSEQGEAAERVRQLPGAGPVLAPRIYVALARYADQCPDGRSLAAAVGIAPVTDQSGKMKKIYRRFRCDTFTRQSFVEWCKEAYKQSAWSQAFMDQQKANGHGFHASLRALAYKWIRILWRCWRDRVPYDETKYVECLRRRNSPLVANLKVAI